METSTGEKGYGSHRASAARAPLLGQLPIDPELAKLCDEGDIECYNGEIVTKLGETLSQLIKTETK